MSSPSSPLPRARSAGPVPFPPEVAHPACGFARSQEHQVGRRPRFTRQKLVVKCVRGSDSPLGDGRRQPDLRNWPWGRIWARDRARRRYGRRNRRAGEHLRREVDRTGYLRCPRGNPRPRRLCSSAAPVLGDTSEFGYPVSVAAAHQGVGSRRTRVEHLALRGEGLRQCTTRFGSSPV